MRYIDLLKANENEASFLNGEIPPACKLVITQGPSGCKWIENAAEHHVAGVPTKEIDSTGASDSFIAGLAVELLKKWIYRELLN